MTPGQSGRYPFWPLAKTYAHALAGDPATRQRLAPETRASARNLSLLITTIPCDGSR